jgi:hypothetical protein
MPPPDPVDVLRADLERLIDVVGLLQQTQEHGHAGVGLVLTTLRDYIDTIDEYVRLLERRIERLEAAARVAAARPAGHVH